VGWNFLGNQLGKEEIKAAIIAGLLVEKEQGGSYDRFRDRILFPISDISGRICGFGGRIVGEGQPKYLNSPESPVFNKSKLLLGLFQQKEFIRKQNHGILVEGNFDLISLVAHGCNNVAAPLGTALTREQLRLLKRFAEKVTLLFDGDEAGKKAAVRAVPLFLAEQIPGRVAFLPAGHDPDTFVRQQGLADLNVLLEQAVALPEFALEHLVGKHGLTLDGKSKILEELRPLIAVAASPLQRSLFIAHFAEKLGLTVGQLGADLQGPAASVVQLPVEPTQRVRPEPRTSLGMAQRQLLQFMIIQPQCFPRLAAAGLRDCLAGSIGEILFLELDRLIAANHQTEPEELLSVLPEGAERTLVADILLRSQGGASEGEEDFDQELTEILRYLKTFQLKKQSEEIMQQIEIAERNGHQQLLQELLAEKQKITGQLHGNLR
jgi:DNA primase